MKKPTDLLLRSSAKYATKKKRWDGQRVEKSCKPILCGGDHVLPRGRRCRRRSRSTRYLSSRLEPRLPACAAGQHRHRLRALGHQGAYEVVWAYPNRAWQVYDPNDSGGSTLTTMQAGIGYWIKMTSAKTLSVSGTAPSSSIPLRSGWNLVGYNGASCASALDGPLLHGLKPSGLLGLSLSGLEVLRPDRRPGQHPSQLCPGAGYWIDVSNSGHVGAPSPTMCSPSPSTARSVRRPPLSQWPNKPCVSVKICDPADPADCQTVERYPPGYGRLRAAHISTGPANRPPRRLKQKPGAGQLGSAL